MCSWWCNPTHTPDFLVCWLADWRGNRTLFLLRGCWHKKAQTSFQKKKREITTLDILALASMEDSRTCSWRSKVSFFTRQNSDADGASLAERLDRGMLGHASVLSFIHRAHLLQRQLRGRQDPVVPLREKIIQESVERVRQTQSRAESRKIFYWFYCLQP